MLNDNPEFRRAITTIMRDKEEALANFRQHFYMLLPEEQAKFKHNLEQLVAASRPFVRSCITVKLNLDINAYCSQTDESLSVSAIAEPGDVLRAIEDWEHAGERTAALE
jgi:hypothetical protein